jgi:predicted acylesterase/phospholipase RssA
MSERRKRPLTASRTMGGRQRVQRVVVMFLALLLLQHRNEYRVNGFTISVTAPCYRHGPPALAASRDKTKSSSAAPKTTGSTPSSNINIQPPPPLKQHDHAAAATSALVDEWNLTGAAQAFGALLVRLQRREQEELTKTKTKPTRDWNLRPLPSDDIYPVSAMHGNSTPPTQHGKAKMAPVQKEPRMVPPLPDIDLESARELDEAVFPLKKKNQLDFRVLNQTESPTATSTIPWNTTSNFYQERIGRDLRQLAVSVASSIETVDQWREFCRERGGIYPLVASIQEGAAAVRRMNVTTNARHFAEQEDALQLASAASRSLRDLSALSLELAAVITDGLLRANAAWNLLPDLVLLLQHAQSYQHEPRRRQNAWYQGFGGRYHWRVRADVRLRLQLYVTQLLLAMTVASDDAVTALRETAGFKPVLLASSSWSSSTRRPLWRRAQSLLRRLTGSAGPAPRRPVPEGLPGQVQKTSNQLLAAIGHNEWVPKRPGQKGLRILGRLTMVSCLYLSQSADIVAVFDGGGARGLTSVTMARCLVEALGNGNEVADTFDMVVGTSTGAIISFLFGLLRESSEEALLRYNALIQKIFVKSALSTPLMVFTTASYDESTFMDILNDVLKDGSMLDSRADPSTPYVFAVTSKMSSTPTHVALFRNYNYASGELADPFTIDPDDARADTGLLLEWEHPQLRSNRYRRHVKQLRAPGFSGGLGSRYPGSFRVLQRYALRASTAAPTVFKPVMMGGEMYCDGGIVASNPTAVAIHEAKALFPNVPIELVVSMGTGAFLEQKTPPRIGWDGIIGQIVNSATDGEQIHHILQDILGQPNFVAPRSKFSGTHYYRFNPILGLPDAFPIDVNSSEKLAEIQKIARAYMNSPEQRQKVDEIVQLITGKKPVRAS